MRSVVQGDRRKDFWMGIVPRHVSARVFGFRVQRRLYGSARASADCHVLSSPDVCDRDAPAVSFCHHGQGQQSSTARDRGSGGRPPRCRHWSVPRHEYRICYEPIPGPASSLLHFHCWLGQTGVQVLLLPDSIPANFLWGPCLQRDGDNLSSCPAGSHRTSR